MARPQHAEFTQYLLPEEACLNPQHVWDTLLDPTRAPRWLRALWEKARLYANQPAAPIEPTGLASEACAVAGKEAVLITLPTPTEPSEAFMVVLVKANPFRYFMLEAAYGEMRAELAPAGWHKPEALDGTVICSRQPDADVHRRLAQGPPALTPETKSRFLAQVAELLSLDRASVTSTARLTNDN